MWKKCKFYFTAPIDFWQKSFENKTCTKIISMLYRKPIQRKRISFILPNIFLFFSRWCPAGVGTLPRAIFGIHAPLSCWGDRDNENGPNYPHLIRHWWHTFKYKMKCEIYFGRRRRDWSWIMIFLWQKEKPSAPINQGKWWVLMCYQQKRSNGVIELQQKYFPHYTTGN